MKTITNIKLFALLFAVVVLISASLLISGCNLLPAAEEEPAYEPQTELSNSYTSRLFSSLNATGPELQINYPNNWTIAEESYYTNDNLPRFNLKLKSNDSGNEINLFQTLLWQGQYIKVGDAEKVSDVPSFVKESYTSSSSKTSSAFSAYDKLDSDTKSSPLIVAKKQPDENGNFIRYSVINENTIDNGQAPLEYFQYYSWISFNCYANPDTINPQEEREIVAILSSLKQTPSAGSSSTQSGNDATNSASQLLGYWVTPNTGGSGRIYFMYLKPDGTAEEGEVVAQSIHSKTTWVVDSDEGGKVTFHLANKPSDIYTFDTSTQKITCPTKTLTDVNDGVTKLPFYMTKSNVPSTYSLFR